MILLDTCTLLWLVVDPKKLSGNAAAHLREHHAAVFISAISAFEISLKNRQGKLRLPLPPDRWIDETLDFYGIDEIPVDRHIAARAALLPPHHADPCDRMIVATAERANLIVVTPDPLIRAYREVRAAW